MLKMRNIIFVACFIALFLIISVSAVEEDLEGAEASYGYGGKGRGGYGGYGRGAIYGRGGGYSKYGGGYGGHRG